jgi:hypothetical protein
MACVRQSFGKADKVDSISKHGFFQNLCEAIKQRKKIPFTTAAIFKDAKTETSKSKVGSTDAGSVIVDRKIEPSAQESGVLMTQKAKEIVFKRMG